MPSTHCVHPHMQPSSRSHTLSKQDSKSKSSDRHRGSNVERSNDSNDVATELELKTPGSTTADQEVSYVEKKGKNSHKDRGSIREESCSSRCSSSRGLQDSSSNSVGDGQKIDK